MNKNLFGKTINVIYVPVGPFNCWKFWKILRVNPELWGSIIFEPKMANLPKRRVSTEKPLKQFWCTSLLLSLCKTFKQLLEQIQSYDHASFLGLKSPGCPEWVFFRKTINIILIYTLNSLNVQNWNINLPGVILCRFRHQNTGSGDTLFGHPN